MTKAVIGCGVLYSEFLSLLEGAHYDIQFLRQGLHCLSDSTEMKRKIQQSIDQLDKAGSWDRILLGYGLCGGGVEGLKSKSSPLAILKVHDCIPLFLGGKAVKEKIEVGGTYYLSRGWIDCGGDGYKEYLFLTGKQDRWVKKFKKFRSQGFPDDSDIGWWFDRDRYSLEKRNRKKFTEDLTKKITFQCLKNYSQLVLIDNGNLHDIHKDYTSEMYSFLDSLMKESRGDGWAYKEIEGSFKLLEKLLFEDSRGSKPDKDILITPPGEELHLEGRI